MSIPEFTLPSPSPSPTPLPAAPLLSTAIPQLDGRPLRLTISRKALYHDLTANHGIPESTGDSMVLIYLCAHDTRSWWQSRPGGDGVDYVPREDLRRYRAEIEDWCDSVFGMDDVTPEVLGMQLWLDGHATLAVLPDAEKKRAELVDMLLARMKQKSSSGPSAEAGTAAAE